MANNQYNNSRRDGDRVTYELKKSLGVLSTSDSGWTKEVNIIAWNGGADKIDIRDWDPTHARMAKGITLFDHEAEKLAIALAGIYDVGSRSSASDIAGASAASSDAFSSSASVTAPA